MTAYAFRDLGAFTALEFVTGTPTTTGDTLNFAAGVSAADFSLSADTDPDGMRLSGLGKVVVLISDDRVSLPELRSRQFVFADGSKVQFAHRTNNYDQTLAGTAHDDLLIGNHAALPLTLASRDSAGGTPDNSGGPGVLSGDGRYLAFSSLASDLVAGGANPSGFDVFVRDLARGTNQQVTIEGFPSAPWSVTAPAVSLDGALVAFVCNAVSSTNPDGQFVLYAGHDSAQELTRALNFEAVNGSSRSVSLAGNGTRAVYESDASNLVSGDFNGSPDVYAQGTASPGAATLVSVAVGGGAGNGGSFTPSISDDGRSVAFHSNADNLIAGDTNEVADIFVRDLVAGTTVRVSTDAAGRASDQNSFGPVISGNGRYVVFLTLDDSLAPGDSNQDNTDIVRKDLVTGEVKLVSASADGVARSAFEEFTFERYGLAISANGRYVVFASASNNLVADDIDGQQDIFVKDMNTGAIARVRTHPEPLTYAGDNAAPTISADGSRIGFLNSATPGADWQSYVVDNPLYSMRLAGGKGNDTYQVERTDDVIVESAGGGVDTVRSSVSYRLGSQLENLELTGARNTSATGNSLANLLAGNAGNNKLDGRGGSDTVSYAGSIDSVQVSLAQQGKAQNTGSAGRDTLVAVENLTGSAFDDRLTGDARANRLDGGPGTDRLSGAAGRDTFVLASLQGADTVTDFASKIDRVLFDARALDLGDGDRRLEHAQVRKGPNGFDDRAELVLFTRDIAGKLTAKAAAGAIGRADQAYERGDSRIFVVDDGDDTAVYRFTSSGADAGVSADELQLLAVLQNTATALGDYGFG